MLVSPKVLKEEDYTSEELTEIKAQLLKRLLLGSEQVVAHLKAIYDEPAEQDEELRFDIMLNRMAAVVLAARRSPASFTLSIQHKIMSWAEKGEDVTLNFLTVAA